MFIVERESLYNSVSCRHLPGSNPLSDCIRVSNVLNKACKKQFIVALAIPPHITVLQYDNMSNVAFKNIN